MYLSLFIYSIFILFSGGLTQDQRLEAMSKLKQYQCRVLISTDLVRPSPAMCPPSLIVLP